MAAKRKPAAKKPAKTKPKGKGGAGKLHTLREDHPWEINYAAHATRSDSDLYRKSRALLKKITGSTVAKSTPWFFGADTPPKDGWEDHHGGGLWVHDDKGWFFLRNLAGMEWASQFCADPKKIERMRQNAQRLYQGTFYTNTKAAIAKLDPSYPFDRILKTPINTADQVAEWTDSIFNASVPLPKSRHTGVPPKGHGVHHYPTPIYEIELFKHDDFVLWVKDDQGQPAAVVPAHRRGAPKDDPNYGETIVAYATPGTKLHKKLVTAHKKRRALVAPSNNTLTKQAFKKQ